MNRSHIRTTFNRSFAPLLPGLGCTLLAIAPLHAQVPLDQPDTISGGFSLKEPVDRFVDVDEDGDLDLILYQAPGGLLSPGSISILENLDGQGTSWGQTTLVSGDLTRPPVFTDWDLDGDLDLIYVKRECVEWSDELFPVCIGWADSLHVKWNDNGDYFSLPDTLITVDDRGIQTMVAGHGEMDPDPELIALTDDGVSQSLVYFGDFGPITIEDLTGLDPQSLMVTDLDEDGDLDIVVGMATQVRLYRNMGGLVSVSWSIETIDSNASNATDLQTGDINRDGRLDLVTLHQSSAEIVWYETDGAVWFEQSIATSMVVPQSIYVADMDGDQTPDLVVSETDASGSGSKVFLNAGDGSSWSSQSILSAFDAVAWAMPVDVNSDGDQDLVSVGATVAALTLSVSHNRTVGSSPCILTARDISTTTMGPSDVTATDIDGDGDQDLVVASFDDDFFRWFENDGGSPPTLTGHTIAVTGDGPTGVATGDIDGDGDIDVLGCSANDDTVAWYENDGTPDVGLWTEHIIVTNFFDVSAIDLADLDGDGDLDPMAVSPTDTRLTWWENSGAATPTFSSHLVSANIVGARSVRSGDVDNDGDLDMVVAAFGDGKIWMYENDGNSNPFFSKRTVGTLTNVRWADVGDTDGDGDLDIVAVTGICGGIPIVTCSGAMVHFENLGTPFITFNATTIDASVPFGEKVEFQDLDRDGLMDILAVNAPSGIQASTVSMYENDGSVPPVFSKSVVASSLGAAGSIPTIFGASSCTATDLNRDGTPDIVACSADDDRVIWFEMVGSQYGLGTTDIAPVEIGAGESLALIELTVTNNGGAGDADAEMRTLFFSFQNAASGALSSADLQSIVKSMVVRRDDGDGVFDSATDTVVAVNQPVVPGFGLVSVSLDLLPGSSFIEVSPGVPATFFVQVEMQPDADAQATDQFKIVHFPNISELAYGNVSPDILLEQPCPSSPETKVITIVGAPCPADTDLSGDVGIDDFLAVLAGWGECGATCPADTDGDGTVGIDDFLAVLAGWGPCP